jgi:hypothetical protein
MIAVAMLQALLLGFLLTATPPSDEELEERLGSPYRSSGFRDGASLHPRIACRKTGFLSDFRGRAVLLYFWATW